MNPPASEASLPRRAAIYARFSTDLQNDRSIDDQVALCRSHAASRGLSVVAVYSDKAKSGGSLIGRDGALEMLAAARGRAFDVVVVEALDRLSRDMEDLAGLWKRFSALRVEIVAVGEGQITTALIGLRGLVGQLYREDNAAKIRRTLAGHVREGLSAGGLSYGYAPVQGAPGRRIILDAEAAIVRRVFSDYLGGKSPRDIAADLNAAGVTPPRGRRWNASSIVGSRTRGTGLLRNQLYRGRLVWNRLTMIRDPDSGRRISRVNPAVEQHVVDIPELAIIDAEIFAAVQARLSERGGPHLFTRRPRHLLSGMLRCGGCGSGMSVYGRQRDGRIRIRCSSAAENRSCPAPGSYYLDVVERGVLCGLERELLYPEAIAAYVAGYEEERRRLAGAAFAERATIERRVGAIDREAERCIDMMVKGIGDVSRLGQRTKEIALEMAGLKARLAEMPEALPSTVAAHPALIADYRKKLQRLRETLANGIATGETEAASAIRALVERVTVSRNVDGSITIEVSGRLNALLGDRAFPNGRRTVTGGALVAEAGFGRSARLAPVRFHFRAVA